MMGPDGGLYNIVLVLHVMAAIVGFGGFMYSGVIGAHAARRRDPAGAAVADVNYRTVTGIEWPIYAVPVLGIVLLLMSDDVFQFSQAWISMALVVYMVFLGVLHGAHLPTLRRMNTLMGELATDRAGSSPSAAAPPQAGELDRLGTKAGVVGGILNLLIVLAVVLMVFKPGF